VHGASEKENNQLILHDHIPVHSGKYSIHEEKGGNEISHSYSENEKSETLCNEKQKAYGYEPLHSNRISRLPSYSLFLWKITEKLTSKEIQVWYRVSYAWNDKKGLRSYS
jgi:hypothetical protein